MKWFWFPIAVVATSCALVIALGTIVFFPVRVALASGLGAAVLNGHWHGGPLGHGPGVTVPSQIQGLFDLPADQRFSHFEGVQISLKDKDNRPLLVTVTPGTVTAAAATSLTIAANDGTSKTFALDNQTLVRGKSAASNESGNSPPFASGDTVVVVALNNSSTATAVFAGNHGFGPPGPGNAWGPFGHAR